VFRCCCRSALVGRAGKEIAAGGLAEEIGLTVRQAEKLVEFAAEKKWLMDAVVEALAGDGLVPRQG
jgi:hypothetical protein